jgi:hypothetical protein
MPGFARACLVLTAAVALCAAAPSPPRREGALPDSPPGSVCFSPRDIVNFRTPHFTSVLLRVGKTDVFELTFSSPCPDVDWTYGFQVRGGGREVCEGKDQDLEVVPVRTSDSGLGVRCRVTDVHRLTRDEVSALSGRERP